MLNITGGHLRGRTLPALVPEGVRPTSARTREALFSILGQDLEGTSFFDVFGGSGAIALEAASRGAAPVFVTDRSPPAVAAILANVAAMKVVVDVRSLDAMTLCPPEGSPKIEADIVYLDPPFADDIGAWIERLAPCAREVLVAEARVGATFPERAGLLPLDRTRKYGDSVLAVYREPRVRAED